MLRLSVNFLSNALSLLKLIDSNNGRFTNKNISYFQSFSVNTDILLDMADVCKWISIDADNLYITRRGKSLIDCCSYRLSNRSIRLMLADYIVEAQPIWRNRIPYGRKEATIFMTKDEKACFFEAGLLADNPTRDVVEWWDSISVKIRDEQNEKKLLTGRTGEMLTILFEKARTKSEPIWMAIESNKLGYDIISQMSGINFEQRLIEVKTTIDSMDHAEFFVSKNEWDIATHSKNYFFYLWQISSGQNKLAMLKPENISTHIPINQHSGEWENVSIPFREFLSFFHKIDL